MVAQGSNLGPLLFVIFFNDVVSYLQCKAYLYTDDLKLVYTIRTSTINDNSLIACLRLDNCIMHRLNIDVLR